MPSIIVDAAFTARTNMPQVNAIKPLSGATYDWAAGNLPTGNAYVWNDLVAGVALAATTNPPVTSGAEGSRAVLFDGVNDLFNATVSLSGAFTIVLVARYLALPAGNQHLIHRGSNPTAFNLTTDATNTKWVFQGGATINGPTKTPDTAYHVHVITVNGATSAYNIDGLEVTGSTGTTNTTAFRIGVGPSAYHNTEYKRLAFIPGAKDAAGREALRAEVAALYGL